jgi:PAS domain S-box-containing protein
MGLIIRSPIRMDDGALWGLSVLVLDLDAIMGEAGMVGPTGGLAIAVRNSAGEVFWGRREVFDQSPVQGKITFPNGEWDVAAVPLGGWSNADVPGSGLFWPLGILAAVALSLLTYMAASYQKQLRDAVVSSTLEVRKMNEVLRNDVAVAAENERALRTSESRFRLLFDESPLPIFIAVDGRISMVNNTLLSTFGFSSAEEIVGVPFMDFLDPEFVSMAQRFVDERANGYSGVRRYEVSVHTPQGERIPVELNAVGFEHDGVQNTLVIVADLRARYETQRVLEENEATYRALFEESPVAMSQEDFSQAKTYIASLGVEPDDLEQYLREHRDCVLKAYSGMTITKVNGAYATLLGATQPEEMLGGLEDMIRDDTVGFRIAELCAIARGDEKFAGPINLETRDGRLLRAILSWTIPPRGAETYERAFVSLIDMTSEWGMRDELEEYRDDLERLVAERTETLSATNIELVKATRAKDDFLAAMSHELRTPLNSVIGFSGIMLQGLAGELTAEQHRQLEMIQRSGRHLLGLINQVLDLSRIAAEKTSISAFDFDAVGLARSLHDELEHAAERKGLSLRCNCTLDDSMMHSDPQRISQILMNLMSNAIKFTAEGGVTLQISGVDDMVCFEVADTGPGIPAGEREHVFEPFYQISTDVHVKPEGTGLGLAISRDLAHLLGGTLEFIDGPTPGTRAALCLPRVIPEPTDHIS